MPVEGMAPGSPTVAWRGCRGQLQGAWELSPLGTSPWAEGAKLGHQLKAAASSLVAGILKSRRNDPLLAPLVSCGSIQWVSPPSPRERGPQEGQRRAWWDACRHRALVAAALSPLGSPFLFSTFSPHSPDKRQLSVQNTTPFLTYMYIHIHIHISCGFPFFSFF